MSLYRRLVSHLLKSPWYRAAEIVRDVSNASSVHEDTLSPETLTHLSQITVIPNLSLTRFYQLLHLRAALTLLKLTLAGCQWTHTQIHPPSLPSHLHCTRPTHHQCFDHPTPQYIVICRPPAHRTLRSDLSRHVSPHILRLHAHRRSAPPTLALARDHI